MGWVYLMRADDAEEYKIGATKKRSALTRVNSVGKREREGWLVHALRTPQPFALENVLHRHFASARVRGEWFALTVAQVAEFMTWPPPAPKPPPAPPRQAQKAVSTPAESTWASERRLRRERIVNPAIPILLDVRGGRLVT